MPRPEVLAPAGSPAVLAAALAAGADAVYLGLKHLNARRGAGNFSADDLAAAVVAARQRSARIHLTLNIDLASRDLGHAARILALAERCGVHAVLVKDAALLALAPAFPGLEYHVSTQAGVSSSSGVAAAARLGCRRVVLARELTLDEVRACAAVPGVETEVFVQGALCFCVSGRCLLSSWVGGRSGNRGLCTSPCRVPWTAGAGDAARHLSTHDLCAVDLVADLAAASVASLKIEGRLKSAAWVAQAVALYRQAVDGGASLAGAEGLGDYTGRVLSPGHLAGRHDLTGDSGRPAQAGPPQPAMVEEGAAPDHDLVVEVGAGAMGGWSWRCTGAEVDETIATPATVVKRAGRALDAEAACLRLAEELPRPWRLTALTAPEGWAVPPRLANQVAGELASRLRRQSAGDDGVVRGDLPPAVRDLVAAGRPHPANRRPLHDRPDQVRLPAEVCRRLAGRFDAARVVVDGADAAELAALAAAWPQPVVVALPTVLYEADLQAAAALCEAARGLGLEVECNSWDGWELARRAGTPWRAGPGLAVLNHLAARHLAGLGARSVQASVEADGQQLLDLLASAPVPMTVCVFGRPALMRTRVAYGPAGQVLADARGVRLHPRREGQVTALHPDEPFDLRGLRLGVRAAHLEMDLLVSPDPAAEWRSAPAPQARHFNLERTLR